MTSDWISVLQTEALLLSTLAAESINTSPTHKHTHALVCVCELSHTTYTHRRTHTHTRTQTVSGPLGYTPFSSHRAGLISFFLKINNLLSTLPNCRRAFLIWTLIRTLMYCGKKEQSFILFYSGFYFFLMTHSLALAMQICIS